MPEFLGEELYADAAHADLLNRRIEETLKGEVYELWGEANYRVLSTEGCREEVERVFKEVLTEREQELRLELSGPVAKELFGDDIWAYVPLAGELERVYEVGEGQ